MKNNTTKKSFVSVKDTGSGMDQGDFAQISILLQNYLRGTGLGFRLSISNSTIEDNGGKILVQNNADGKEASYIQFFSTIKLSF